jgi:hypothetical protein
MCGIARRLFLQTTGPWPVSATCFIASKRSRRAFATGVMREALSLPRYCSSGQGTSPHHRIDYLVQSDLSEFGRGQRSTNGDPLRAGLVLFLLKARGTPREPFFVLPRSASTEQFLRVRWCSTIFIFCVTPHSFGFSELLLFN